MTTFFHQKHRLTKTESENTSSLGGKQTDDAEGKSTLKEDENGESQDEEMSHTVTLSILIALAFPPRLFTLKFINIFVFSVNY